MLSLFTGGLLSFSFGFVTRLTLALFALTCLYNLNDKPKYIKTAIVFLVVVAVLALLFSLFAGLIFAALSFSGLSYSFFYNFF